MLRVGSAEILVAPPVRVSGKQKYGVQDFGCIRVGIGKVLVWWMRMSGQRKCSGMQDIPVR